MNFLQEETLPYSKELLVMHYLQRGRYVEGIRLNELLKKDKKVCIMVTITYGHCNLSPYSLYTSMHYSVVAEKSNSAIVTPKDLKLRESC